MYKFAIAYTTLYVTTAILGLELSIVYVCKDEIGIICELKNKVSPLSQDGYDVTHDIEWVYFPEKAIRPTIHIVSAGSEDYDAVSVTI